MTGAPSTWLDWLFAVAFGLVLGAIAGAGFWGDDMNETRTGLESFKPYANLHRVTVPQCPPCHGQCHQGRKCNAPDTVPSEYGTGYGDLQPIRPAQPVPCSTLGRWILALKRWLP